MKSVQLIADHVTLMRGSRVVIDGLSFGAKSGVPLVLVGPNGAGKTTLLRALGGFLPPSEGVIRLEGFGGDDDIAQNAHAIGHLNGLKGALTVYENLAFWAAFLGGGQPGSDQIDAALDGFDLTELADIPARYLSAGQKRRAGLCRLLAVPRCIWLLDEPTVSLDAASVALLARAVDRHAADGGIVIAATHVPLGLVASETLAIAPAARAA